MAGQKSHKAKLDGDGAIAQGESSLALGQQAINIQHSVIVRAGRGARVIVGEQPIEIDPKLRKTALGKYLEHIIAHNRYLQLQGIRSGGKLVNIELEQIYITLRTTQQRTLEAEENWLAAEASLAPGEMSRQRMERLERTETISISVDQALATHRHLVVVGDPGSGKTTLLRYLALLYGRDLAEGTKVIRDKLNLAESGYLPILLPLRQIGAFLRAHNPSDDGTEGHALLLEFLFQSLKNQRIEPPLNFFDSYLQDGKALVLLDGLDEVADPALRARVARLVESFTLAYPTCRFVVTSRVVGYTGAARLGGDYVTTTVRDFNMDDVHQFLTHWHLLVAVGQMGPGESAENYAAGQTEQLLQAIQANERIRELAINPLMLTVIALVHRDRVKLPDRRAELYAEAVDVLLGKWDEARGLPETVILEDKPFDAGDRRLMLQGVALYMQEKQEKEIFAEDLRSLLTSMFQRRQMDTDSAAKCVERFLRVVEERTGLLVARGEGVYAFSHLTFQEYLAALAVAARDDYVAYTLARAGEAWWQEVVLLEAGHLSTQSAERTTRLIRAIADSKLETESFHNLVLAAECLRDVGSNRVEDILENGIQAELQKQLRIHLPTGLLREMQTRLKYHMSIRQVAERRLAAANALARIGGRQFWKPPFGEPEWVSIPAGEFWMGGNGKYDGKPIHKLSLPEFQISKVPVTNAQYELFVKATKHDAPRYWEDGHVPKGKESHPVVEVRWYDAIAYCDWLGEKTGKRITLPSEAEWEKAARGNQDQRNYPWGEEFDPARCNSYELGLGSTTPVGIFLEGQSPYGLLDMSGNVWEWTRSIYGEYPYPTDEKDRLKRENLKSKDAHVLRGGAFLFNLVFARCAYRFWDNPDLRLNFIGFRIVVSPLFLS